MVGSTHLLVAWPLTLVTLGIEFHHIHHASTRVPCYNLAACHEEGMNLKGGDFWKRAGINQIGPRRAALSMFHTLFEDGKVEKEGTPMPRFTTFEPYKSLGLYDCTGAGRPLFPNSK